MTYLYDHPAVDFRPGDVWCNGTERIEVHAVEPIAPDAEFYPGGVRITGIIVKGYGASRRQHSWAFHHDRLVEIERLGADPRPDMERQATTALIMSGAATFDENDNLVHNPHPRRATGDDEVRYAVESEDDAS